MNIIEHYKNEDHMQNLMIADKIAKYLRMGVEGLVAEYKVTPLYRSEYTPLIRAILRVYHNTNSLTHQQFISLATYLAFRPEYH